MAFRANAVPGGSVYAPPDASDLDRLAVTHVVDLSAITNGSSDDFPIEDWTTIEGGSGGIHLDSPDFGEILFDDAGIYAINVSLDVTGLPAADPTMSLCVRTFTLGGQPWQNFDVSARGGDCPGAQPGSSHVYYRGGSTDFSCSVYYQNFDKVEVSAVEVNVHVQRLGGSA